MASCTDTQHDFLGELLFQSNKVPRSLEPSGEIYADVDPITGGFATWVGDDKDPLRVPIYNARGKNMSADQNGFELVEHNLSGVDFYNEEEIFRVYYPAVAEFIKNFLGAHKVYTFDHVVRNSGVGNSYAVKSGQKIGGPARQVHGDYGMRGGITRIQNFTKPPTTGDSFVEYNEGKPLIAPEDFEQLKGRRFAIINLWRSFTDEPCVDMPLSFCDTQTTRKEDYATIEFRYSTGVVVDTYLAGYSPQQKWYYFPELMKHEGVLLKTFDTQGALFDGFSDSEFPYRIPGPLIPATATLHSAVPDPRLEGKEFTKRQSIEVRTVVFY